MVRQVDVVLEPGERTDLPSCCNASASQSSEMRPPSWLSRRGGRGAGELHHSRRRQRHSATTIHIHGMPSAQTARAKVLQWQYAKGQRLEKKINQKAKGMRNKLFQYLDLPSLGICR